MAVVAKRLIAPDEATGKKRSAGHQGDLPGETLTVRAARPSADQVETFLDLAVQEMASMRACIDVDDIERAAELIEESERRGGRVHVTGVGKSEYIARYFASLLSSTGTPAYFLHATECVHGSAGQVCKEDIAIVISNSGATPEILSALNALRSLGNAIIGISSNRTSPLAQKADMLLYAGASREDCLLNLAPRASVLTKTYVLCALSISLEARKGLTRDQYARWHPAGALGRQSRGD
jgi:arabinose-5-phosphate isomerase